MVIIFPALKIAASTKITAFEASNNLIFNLPVDNIVEKVNTADDHAFDFIMIMFSSSI